MIKICRLSAFIVLTTATTGCVGNQTALTLDQQLKMIEKDIAGLFTPSEKQETLDLSDAMARGIKYNLDRRLAQQQEIVADSEHTLSKLSILPDLDLEASSLGRSSLGGSSSQSVRTGQTSLEPSISSDQYRRTATLEASWNVLDTGLNFVRSKQSQNEAFIAKERKRKVVHNIIQDVRYAFWRAVASELIQTEAATLQKKAQETIRYLQTAEALNLEDAEVILKKQSSLLESIHEMNRLKSELSFAKTELAALVNLQSSNSFTLKTTPYSDINFLAVPTFTLGASELESIALVLRPEIREEGYNKRIQDDALTLAVLETFPGVELFTRANYDSNQFLEEQRWVNFSVSLSQSLIKLFTLPARYENEKNKQKAGELRRQALAAAVMTQIRIAMTRYQMSKEQFSLMKKINGVDQRMANRAKGQAYAEIISEPDLVLAEIRSLLSKTRTYLAYADLQNSFGRVINTTGIDPISSDIPNANLHEIKLNIEHQLANQNKVIEDIYWAIYDKSGGAFARHVQPVVDYGSIDAYTKAIYNEQSVAVITEAQPSYGTKPKKPTYAPAPMPSMPVKSIIQEEDFVLPKYPGSSQPILDGDPYLKSPPAETKAPQMEVKAQPIRRAPLPVEKNMLINASYESSKATCDTYYDIQNGCDL